MIPRKRGRPKKNKERTIEDIKREINFLIDIPIDYEHLLSGNYKYKNRTEESDTFLDARQKMLHVDAVEETIQSYKNRRFLKCFVAFNQEFMPTSCEGGNVRMLDINTTDLEGASPQSLAYAMSFEEITEKIRTLLNEYSQMRRLNEKTSDLEERQAEFELRVETEEEEAIEEEQTQESKSKRLSMSRKAPLVEFEEDGWNGIDEASRQILVNNKEHIFHEGVTYQEQIELVYNLLKPVNIGPTKIANLFGVTRGTIANHILRFNKKQLSPGRPVVLNESEIDMLVGYIYESFARNKPRNYIQLQDFIYDKIGKSIKMNTIYHIISKNPKIKTVTGIPMEKVRAESTLESIIDYYDRLKCALQYDIPTHFFFNMDESGIQEFVDKREMQLLVPSSYPDDSKVYSVNRGSKRSTLIGCICLDGSALKPCIISPSKTIETELITCGYNEENVLIISQESGFVNKEAFNFWADEILFPEIRKRRILYNYWGEAILTMDGCKAHFSDHFLDQCSYENVHPIPEPPGTSDQVQPLDLGIFGPMKAVQRPIRQKNLKQSSKNIMTMVDSWLKTVVPSNVTAAFEAAGIFGEVNKDNVCVARANLEYARAVRNMEHIECHHVVMKKTQKLKEF